MLYPIGHCLWFDLCKERVYGPSITMETRWRDVKNVLKGETEKLKVLIALTFLYSSTLFCFYYTCKLYRCRITDSMYIEFFFLR